MTTVIDCFYRQTVPNTRGGQTRPQLINSIGKKMTTIAADNTTSAYHHCNSCMACRDSSYEITTDFVWVVGVFFLSNFN